MSARSRARVRFALLVLGFALPAAAAPRLDVKAGRDPLPLSTVPAEISALAPSESLPISAPAAAQTAGPAIVPAAVADLDQIVKIEKVSFPKADRFSRKEWKEFLQDPDLSSKVIRAKGRVAAAILYGLDQTDAGQRLYVFSIGVHPDFRKRGYGESLVKQAIETAASDRRTGSVELHVRESNAPAVALYNKFGFSVLKIEPRYYEGSENALHMRLAVPPR